MTDGIAGTVAFVVGGSRGLGADLAAALHKAGARTVAVSRHPAPEAPPWEQELLDAADPEAVERFFDVWGPMLAERNVLANFAGARSNVPLVDSDPRDPRQLHRPRASARPRRRTR